MSARFEVHTAPLSIPTLASSADGFTMAGSGNSAGVLLAWASTNAGTGSPAAESSVLATCFRWQMVVGQVRQPVNGTPVSSSVPTTRSSYLAWPLMPSHRLKTRSARRARLSQRKSPSRTGQQLDVVAPAPEHVPHLVDVAHDRGDVLRAPLVAAGIEQDRDLHHATSARSERPLIRRHAMSATVRISSS